MTLYLDTSVLVQLYIREDDSEEVATAVADATVVATRPPASSADA